MKIIRFACSPRALAAVLVTAAAFATPAAAQQSFASPSAAAEALVDGLARHDGDALRKILGTAYASVLPVGEISGEDLTRFLESWASSNRIVESGKDRAFLGVGSNGWTLPVPLVKSAGGWRFDVGGARDEMRTRRIGRNELAAMQVLLAIGDAQAEYRARNMAQGAFAARIISSPGKRDGLYWPTAVGEPESPAGPLPSGAGAGQGYHGYHYRILTSQGASAPGGARSYASGGQLTGGFAAIAWPARYGETGVMTFLMGPDGALHEQDFGPATDKRVRGIQAYDPDSGWARSR